MRLSLLLCLLTVAAPGCSTFSEAYAAEDASTPAPDAGPDTSMPPPDGSTDGASPPTTYTDGFERADANDVQGLWGALTNEHNNGKLAIDRQIKMFGDSSLRVDTAKEVVQDYVGYNGRYPPLQKMQFYVRIDPLPESGKQIMIAQLIFDTKRALNVKVTNQGITIAEQGPTAGDYTEVPTYSPFPGATWVALTWTFDADAKSMSLRDGSGSIALDYKPTANTFSNAMTNFRIGAVYADVLSGPQVWFDQFSAQ